MVNNSIFAKQTRKKMPELVLKKDFLSFPDKKKELKELASNYKNLVITNKTLPDAKKARLVLREERYSIQKIELHNKSILNDLKRRNKLMAEELVNEIKPTEDTIHNSIKDIEEKIEAERERKRKEREKMREKQRLDALNILDPLTDVNASSSVAFVTGVLNDAELIKITKKGFGDYYDSAISNKDAIIDRCKQRIEEVKTMLEINYQKAVSEYINVFGEKPEDGLDIEKLKSMVQEKKKEKQPKEEQLPVQEKKPVNVTPPKKYESVDEVNIKTDSILLNDVLNQLNKIEIPEFTDEMYVVFAQVLKDSIDDIINGIITFKTQ